MATKRKGVVGDPSIVRRSITLDAALDREAHALVGDGGFSAFVADALRHLVQREKMARFLNVLDQEHGLPSPEDTIQAEEAWQALHQPSLRSTAAR